MNQWPRRGQEQAPKVSPPPRPLVAPQPVWAKEILAKASCTDCGSTTRKLTQVSPKVQLCATDIRERKKVKRQQRRDGYQRRTFSLTLVEKEELIEFQGGGCICAEWTGYNGKTRALSTDHDHRTGVVRGALCKHCNDLLGRVRDDPAYFRRMIAYLENPPAVRLFGQRLYQEGD